MAKLNNKDWDQKLESLKKEILKAIQDSKKQIVEEFKRYTDTLREEIKEIKEIKDRAEKTEENIEKMDEQTTLTECRDDMEHHFDLKYRLNYLYAEKKNLPKDITVQPLTIMTKELSLEMQYRESFEDMEHHFDLKYRLNYFYAEKKNLPKDITVHFLTIMTKELTLEMQYRESFEIVVIMISAMKKLPKIIWADGKINKQLTEKFRCKGIT